MVTSAAAAASSSSAPPPPSSSALLAPGFRFHPTDEELVIYYLKRKVSGRPFRFHAIADVDLYKSEPWDLPSLSLLQTRDMEWYFFSPIDRKYSNRSRTNRATGLGYWKTTGKDRLIRHNSRLVGMKKTLVFHAGRAPRGDRTNWVMHEYRLDDEELARAGLAQVGYVVCRIFQKNGAGPQNGAQYGAPFVDEEWEETDPWVPQIENGGEYLELDDMELNQGLNVQHEDAALLLESNGEDGGSHQENPTTLLEEMLKNQNVIDGTDRFITLPELQGNPGAFNGMGENTGMTDQSHSPPSEKYGFVELNDLGETEDVDYLSSVDFVGDHRLIQNGHQSVNRKGVSSNVAVVHHIEEFFDTMEKNNDMPEPFHTVENNNYLQTNDLLKPMVAEDNVGFFDAPDDNLPTAQGSFGQTNNLMYPPMDDSCGLEMVDELMAYFDATADKLHYATLDSLETLKTVDSCILEQSNLTQEVDRGSSPTCEALPNPSEADIRRAASSSIIVPEIDNLSRGRNNDATITPDTQGNDGWNGAVTRYLVNMLGSISSPPAFAAEFPSKAGKFVGQNAATHSASSVHITAEMIQVKDLIVTGSVKPWSLQKNGDVGFLLSYGVTNNDVVAKSVNRKPVTKMHGGAMSVVLRGGFYLFFLSALILTASFKVGIYIYTK